METDKIFQNGKSQAVRLTKKYFSSQDHCWETLFESLEKFSDDFMEGDRQQPEVQARESAFE